ncbi:MAG TPA: hypothetical protein PKD54_13850, partial [Pirellulaceae bacterium]|nr:hypothetical protein [Pirellulaceae bacterium]
RFKGLPSVDSQEEVTESAQATGESVNPSSASVVVVPSRDPGGLARLAKPIGRLVHIVGRDGRLTLDQQHWAQQFGGKTIRQLVKETEDFIRDQQLPGEWFQPERENELALDYPPVIFRSIKDDLGSDVISEAQWQRWSHETNSSGWTDTIFSRRHRLTLDWGFDSKPSLFGNLFPSSSKSFRLSVEEIIAPRRELVVEASVDGRLLIRVGSRHDQWVIQVVQFPDGTLVVQDVRGIESRSLRVESFDELSTLHGEYLAEELLPILRAVGIELH